MLAGPHLEQDCILEQFLMPLDLLKPNSWVRLPEVGLGRVLCSSQCGYTDYISFICLLLLTVSLIGLWEKAGRAQLFRDSRARALMQTAPVTLEEHTIHQCYQLRLGCLAIFQV